jgi:competence protein ComEC
VDVGQGDAILIDLEDIEVLIDGGERNSGVVSYLKSHVDGPLEVMVASHPHADHIGGLIDVLAAFQVLEIWHNGDTSTAKTYADFMSAVEAENAKVSQAVRGDSIEADGLVFKVLHPQNLKDTTNNNSIVLHFAFGHIDFLFTGDAEEEAETSMLGADLIQHVEILKVGHHGSRTASSPGFLARLRPDFAIYMAGIGNSYGHPHQETLDALAQIGAKVYGTDVNGSIVVTTDGNTLSIETQR